MADELIRLQLVAEGSSATGTIREVSSATKQLNVDLSEAGAAGARAGQEISEGMQKAMSSTTEARHAAILLGEEVGVRVPRALSMVLASSQTLGPILAAAFSAIAVVGFIELAKAAGEKLSSWISDTFIFTEAEKDLNKELLESNKAIEDYAKKTELLARVYDEIGKKGTALTDIKLGFQTDDILKVQAQIRALQDNMYGLRDAGEADSTEYRTMGDQLGLLQSKLKEMQQENQNTAKIREEQAREEGNRVTEATLQATKDEVSARANLLAEAAKEMESGEQANIGAAVNLEKLAAKQKLEADKSYIEGKIKIAEQDPMSNKAEITALQGQLTTLETSFQADMLRIDANAQKQKQELEKKQLEDTTKLHDEALRQELEQEQKLSEATLKVGEAQLKLNLSVREAAVSAQEDLVAKDLAAGHVRTAMQDQEKLVQLLQQQKDAELAIVDAKLAEAKAGMEVAKLSGNAADYETALAQWTQFQAEKVKVASEADNKISQAQDQMLKEEHKGLTQTLSSFNNEWGTFFAQTASGQETMGKAAIRMYTSMENAFLSMIAKKTMSMLEGLALAELTNDKEKLSAAKVAAANAYKSEAGVPFIGPILAPIMAAAAFAGAMAFQQGGIVPSAAGGMMTDASGSPAGTLSLLHPNEMVLPAPISQTVQDMAAKAGPGSGSGDVHIHAMDAQSFQTFLKRNPTALAAGINHASARGHYSVRNNAKGK